MTTIKYLTPPQNILSAQFFLVFAISLSLLILSAKIQVPMIPVPITFQTAVILLLPCLFGWTLTASVLSSYLLLGALGVPVFALGAAGPAYFMGPTGGYLVGFVIAAFFMAQACKTQMGQKIWGLMVSLFFAHMIILVAGCLWLAFGVPALGMEKAFMGGVLPFISGSALKTLMVAGIVYSLPDDKK